MFITYLSMPIDDYDLTMSGGVSVEVGSPRYEGGEEFDCNESVWIVPGTVRP